MDRIDDIMAFVTVVEAGSFTAASNRMGVAKSAISRRVAALEKRLGVQLLRRTTRRLNLTDSGRSFYASGTRILADLDEAESAVAQEHGELRGTLRIALPLSFGTRHMCGPIADFAESHPKIHFDVDLNDRRIDLLEERMDLAIRIGRLPDSQLIARRLFDAKTIMCASPDYLKAFGTPQTPEDLLQHRCLVYGNLAEPTRLECKDRLGNSVRVDIKAAMTANSGDFLGGAAARGLGIVVQPTFIAGEAVSRGELLPVLTEYEWPVIPAYAVYPPTRHLSYRVRAFIDFLADRFAGLPYWDQECKACQSP